MSHMYYFATQNSGEIAPNDLNEVFEVEQGQPTLWDDKLGQFVANPNYVEHAILDLAASSSAYLREELGLEGSDTDGWVIKWPIADVQAKIAAFRAGDMEASEDGPNDYVERLSALVDLGARHGATHLAMA
ncbi:hypothetical protein ACOI1H_23240 [Loktanella sp. DJP18]|uniref:hypothetical protein n=1 Tax=Loktanella sp. DJP18 TaxID=3409788 RepID=UPI003BB6B98D